MVDCYSPLVGHDAEEARFVVPSPAPDARTNRRRHRNRLTPHHLQGGLTLFAASGRSACTEETQTALVSRLKTVREPHEA